MTNPFTRHSGAATRALRVVGTLFVSAFALSVASNPARASLLAYEGFDYAAGANIVGLGGGFGFANAWQLNSSGVGSSSLSVAGSLGYIDGTGHAVFATGNSALFSGQANGGSTAQPNRDFFFSRGTNGVDGGSTWLSMLVRRSGVTTNNLAQPGNAYPRGANVSLYNVAAQEKLAIGNSSGAVSNTVALVPAGGGGNIRQTAVSFSDQVDFVLVRIDHIAGAANDNAYIWVNPLNLSLTPDIRTALTNSIGLFDYSFDRIRPFAGGGNATQPGAVLAVDEIRVGTDYGDVVPFTPAPVPEPSTLALGGLGVLVCLGLRKRQG